MLWSKFLSVLDFIRSDIRATCDVKQGKVPLEHKVLSDLYALLEAVKTNLPQKVVYEFELDSQGRPIIPPELLQQEVSKKIFTGGTIVKQGEWTAVVGPREGGYVSRPTVLEESTEEEWKKANRSDRDLDAIVGDE